MLLFWFAMTLMLAMFLWSFFLNRTLLRPGTFVLFSVLFTVHILLHWRVNWVEKHRRWLPWYVLVQGFLAFEITFLSGNIGMIFCLFMALIGETLALFRITFGGILATLFFLGLAMTNFVLLAGLQQAGWFALGTIPMTIFIGIYVILFSRQAEANARARKLLEELETANHQLSEYAAQVEDLTLAAERQRMARELHDTLSQGLAGLILQLEAADAHLAGGHPDRGRAILQQSMEKARATLAEARQAIDDLRRPASPDLVEAIRQEAAHFSTSTGIACEPLVDLEQSIPEAVAEAAGRAVAEGLTNVARHARAQKVDLRVAGKESGLVIEICDDGVGFDPEAIQSGHYGLLGMRERVRLAGGSLDVRSAPGQGTCLTVRFPLEAVVYE